jgi:hypothetical protein
MPHLTRRRSAERPDCWHVYYDDVHVGTIARRASNPYSGDPWEWTCGFYPGSRPGEIKGGAAPSFEAARASFESAWAVFLANRTPADFEAWRHHQVWTEEKYRRFDRGEQMPPNWKPSPEPDRS